MPTLIVRMVGQFGAPCAAASYVPKPVTSTEPETANKARCELLRRVIDIVGSSQLTSGSWCSAEFAFCIHGHIVKSSIPLGRRGPWRHEAFQNAQQRGQRNTEQPERH